MPQGGALMRLRDRSAQGVGQQAPDQKFREGHAWPRSSSSSWRTPIRATARNWARRSSRPRSPRPWITRSRSSARRPSGRLLKKGVAEKLFVKEGSPKSVYDFIKDAHEAGVKFLSCSPNLDLFDMTKEDMIPECSGIVGGAYLIEAGHGRRRLQGSHLLSGSRRRWSTCTHRAFRPLSAIRSRMRRRSRANSSKRSSPTSRRICASITS